MTFPTKVPEGHVPFTGDGYSTFRDEFPLTMPKEGPVCGFDCPPGWTKIVMEICRVVEAINQALPPGTELCICEQVKEKFGTLRFYMSRMTEEMSQIIEAGEEASEKVCQDCGAPGTIRDGSWVLTQCDKCASETAAKRLGELKPKKRA